MNKNFLEAHLARQLDTRKAQLDYVAKFKPDFVGPVIKYVIIERIGGGL